MIVEFTRDRQRVIEGIKRISGGASSGSAAESYRMSVLEAFAVGRGDMRVYDSVVRRECAMFTSELDQARCPEAVRAEARRVVAESGTRLRQFGAGFGSLIAAIGRIDAPKLVIVFSAGHVSPEAAPVLQALAPEVAAARAAIYVMRLEGTAAAPDLPLSFAADDRVTAGSSLDALAGIGRGTVYDVSGSGDTSFRRLAVESSSYYLIGIEPEAADRDGKPHRIGVTVGKPEVTVRARPTFVARPVSADASGRLVRELRSPVLATEVPVRLTAFCLADEAPDKVRVLVVGEIDRQQQKPGVTSLGFALFDGQGKAVASFSHQGDLPVTRSGRLAFVSGTAVPPGRYTLKLVAVREGRAGSAEHPVDARLATTASLQTGDLVLGEAPAPGGEFLPAVDGRLRGDRIVGYLQLGHAPGTSRELAVEIVKRADGPALLSVPFTLQPSKARATAIQVNIDTRLLPPGDYGARLVVPADGGTAAAAFAAFSLERVPRGRAAAAGGAAVGATAGAKPGAAPTPTAGAKAGVTGAPRPPGPMTFAVKDVLDATVLGPFLDELAERAPGAPKGAIEKVRAGRFEDAWRN